MSSKEIAYIQQKGKKNKEHSVPGCVNDLGWKFQDVKHIRK